MLTNRRPQHARRRRTAPPPGRVSASHPTPDEQWSAADFDLVSGDGEEAGATATAEPGGFSLLEAATRYALGEDADAAADWWPPTDEATPPDLADVGTDDELAAPGPEEPAGHDAPPDFPLLRAATLYALEEEPSADGWPAQPGTRAEETDEEYLTDDLLADDLLADDLLAHDLLAHDLLAHDLLADEAAPAGPAVPARRPRRERRRRRAERRRRVAVAVLTLVAAVGGIGWALVQEGGNRAQPWAEASDAPLAVPVVPTDPGATFGPAAEDLAASTTTVPVPSTVPTTRTARATAPPATVATPTTRPAPPTTTTTAPPAPAPLSVPTTTVAPPTTTTTAPPTLTTTVAPTTTTTTSSTTTTTTTPPATTTTTTTTSP